MLIDLDTYLPSAKRVAGDFRIFLRAIATFSIPVIGQAAPALVARRKAA